MNKQTPYVMSGKLIKQEVFALLNIIISYLLLNSHTHYVYLYLHKFMLMTLNDFNLANMVQLLGLR